RTAVMHEVQVVVEEEERQRRALDDDRASFRPLVPLVLSESTDRDQPEPEPGRYQRVEPERDAEAVDDDRHDDSETNGVDRPGDLDSTVAFTNQLQVAEEETDDRQPRSSTKRPTMVLLALSRICMGSGSCSCFHSDW